MSCNNIITASVFRPPDVFWGSYRRCKVLRSFVRPRLRLRLRPEWNRKRVRRGGEQAAVVTALQETENPKRKKKTQQGNKTNKLCPSPHLHNQSSAEAERPQPRDHWNGRRRSIYTPCRRCSPSDNWESLLSSHMLLHVCVSSVLFFLSFSYIRHIWKRSRF